MTVKQAALWLHCSVATIYSLCAKRLLRHTRIGLKRGKILISEDALAEFINGREVGVVRPNPVPPPISHRRGDGFMDYYQKVMDEVAAKRRR